MPLGWPPLSRDHPPELSSCRREPHTRLRRRELHSRLEPGGGGAGRLVECAVRAPRGLLGRRLVQLLSGLGPRADWLREIHAAGGAQLDFGQGPSSAAYRSLSVEEATRCLRDASDDGSPDAQRRLA